MTVLGIETSCDDTAVAVLHKRKVCSNVIASQAIHLQFGGVVPELASRAHHRTISQTVEQALSEAGLDHSDIDLIAVTAGPGLMGSLLVGLSFAKGLSLSLGVPIVGVHHLEAHVYANFIDNSPKLPLLALTVSGGHTQIELISGFFEHTILGKTLDDAAGEAFDKTGKMLGLDYPAGPEMDRRSQMGNPAFHPFPRALMSEGMDFSFSGLKTSVLYFLQKLSTQYIQENLNDICASISAAVTDVLVHKLARAVEDTGVERVALAGGVSANSMLRHKVNEMATRKGIEVFSPRVSYCTDNGAMIAITGLLKAEHLKQTDRLDIKPFASA